MTTITAPVLASVPLPHPAEKGYLEDVEWRGGYSTMASGSLTRDLLSSTGKLIFEITWTLITLAEAADIITAYGAVVAADATFVSPFGDSYTVQPGDSQPVRINYVPTTLGMRADVTIRLREA